MILVTVSTVEIANELQIAFTNLTHPYVEILFQALSQNCEKWLTASSSLSVLLSAWNNLAPTGRIFMKSGIWVFFRTTVEKIQVSLKPDNITGTLHTGQYTFLPILLNSFRMRNISEEIGRENQNTHFVFNNFFFSKNRAVYEIM